MHFPLWWLIVWCRSIEGFPICYYNRVSILLLLYTVFVGKIPCTSNCKEQPIRGYIIVFEFVYHTGHSKPQAEHKTIAI